MMLCAKGDEQATLRDGERTVDAWQSGASGVYTARALPSQSAACTAHQARTPTRPTHHHQRANYAIFVRLQLRCEGKYC